MKRESVGCIFSKKSNSRSHFERSRELLKCKRSQVTVFVIIAIALVAAIGGYFVFKNFYTPTIPENLLPAYDHYISCANNILKDGASILGSQGGYIEEIEFSPGSEYAPFSNYLGFMGIGIPYWYYISGNGIKKEQIPTKNQMQNQLGTYIKEEILSKCKLDSFIQSGFDITLGEISSAKTAINNNKISGSFSQSMVLSFGDSKVSINNHKLNINSNIGNFYELANKIYSYEKKSSFLENYSLDVLYNYAPVSGVALNCSPTIWSPYNVVTDLKKALAANIGMIKSSGDYYNLKSSTSKYFVADKNGEMDSGSTQVRFLYSDSWPSRFEIWPTKNNLMMTDPIGTQPGLSILGFCYAPYKFVYDMYFPVLVQISNPGNADEVFQFPLAVVINKNVPREALPGDYVEPKDSLCDDNKRNTEITINTYDVNLNPVEALIEYKCLNDACGLGKTLIENYSNLATLNARVPQCVNGILSARVDGYKLKRQIMSTTEEFSADVVLDKEYKMMFEVYVDGVLSNDMAVLSVTDKPLEGLETSALGGNFASVIYPFSKEISLAEGNYNFDLKVYKSGSVDIPSTTTSQCVSVPKSGVMGLFGAMEDKCTDITVPAQKLTNVLYAGGKIEQYITPSEMENANILRVYVKSVPLPKNIEEIQSGYDSIESKSLQLELA